ncbi:MAG: hypothetical protein JWO73_520 [Candidatus Taylorbacteria bacterium]|nr:hypothetical protein [Candidatus Taylorbacteria bacterium]
MKTNPVALMLAAAVNSGSIGSLGILHLPRLWSKVVFEGDIKLDEEAIRLESYFDEVVLRGIGIDPKSVFEYLRSEKPTYPDFEEWILERAGAKLDDDAVAEINRKILAHEHEERISERILRECGLGNPQDIGKTPRTALHLNNLRMGNIADCIQEIDLHQFSFAA